MTAADARVEDTRLLEVMDDVWSLLAEAWKGKKCQCPLGMYAPDIVRFWLDHWQELSSAVEGVSASGASPIRGRTDGRRTLVVIRADLTMGTDRAFTNGQLLMWDSVYRIYKRQDRLSYLHARRRELARWELEHMSTRRPEPERAWADQDCVERISRMLGWQPHDVCEPVA